ncbi:MAG: hypothetical protein LBU67_05365, partial [Oscillospiraceae bacterium]|nr:hypothetical protein [Oscillospiraceae bacterium]
VTLTMTSRSFRFGCGLLFTHHFTKPIAACPFFTYLLYLDKFMVFENELMVYILSVRPYNNILAGYSPPRNLWLHGAA